MDTQVTVSVIVCTRNRAHYLSDCLRSLAAQKCDSPFEVVVIDNGSTDETPAVIRQWCEQDPRFRSAREDRPGLSRAKNAGVRAARGGLLVFTDDDVVIEPHWLATYCEFFARHSAESILAGGPIIPVPDDLADWPAWFDQPALCELGLLDYQAERPLEEGEYLWGANMAIPRTVFTAFGPWDETVGRKGDERGTFEDVEYQERVKELGGAVWFCPAAFVRHRVDRRTITPRRVVSTAFARGRNAFWQENLRTWGTADAVPRRSLTKCLSALAGCLSLWGLWTIAFRLWSGRNLFERMRHAAWSYGWWLGSLDAGRRALPSYGVILRGVWLMRELVLRLAPEASR